MNDPAHVWLSWGQVRWLFEGDRLTVGMLQEQRPGATGLSLVEILVMLEHRPDWATSERRAGIDYPVPEWSDVLEAAHARLVQARGAVRDTVRLPWEPPDPAGETAARNAAHALEQASRRFRALYLASSAAPTADRCDLSDPTVRRDQAACTG